MAATRKRREWVPGLNVKANKSAAELLADAQAHLGVVEGRVRAAFDALDGVMQDVTDVRAYVGFLAELERVEHFQAQRGRLAAMLRMGAIDAAEYEEMWAETERRQEEEAKGLTRRWGTHE